MAKQFKGFTIVANEIGKHSRCRSGVNDGRNVASYLASLPDRATRRQWIKDQNAMLSKLGFKDGSMADKCLKLAALAGYKDADVASDGGDVFGGVEALTWDQAECLFPFLKMSANGGKFEKIDELYSLRNAIDKVVNGYTEIDQTAVYGFRPHLADGTLDSVNSINIEQGKALVKKVLADAGKKPRKAPEAKKTPKQAAYEYVRENTAEFVKDAPKHDSAFYAKLVEAVIARLEKTLSADQLEVYAERFIVRAEELRKAGVDTAKETVEDGEFAVVPAIEDKSGLIPAPAGVE